MEERIRVKPFGPERKKGFIARHVVGSDERCEAVAKGFTPLIEGCFDHGFEKFSGNGQAFSVISQKADYGASHLGRWVKRARLDGE